MPVMAVSQAVPAGSASFQQALIEQQQAAEPASRASAVLELAGTHRELAPGELATELQHPPKKETPTEFYHQTQSCKKERKLAPRPRRSKAPGGRALGRFLCKHANGTACAPL